MFSANSSQVSGDKLFVEDVFSTYLYTGTGAAQTITNGIDLAGKGGLVWIKSRSNIVDNFLFDTTRGVNVEINSNKTDANATLADSVTAFNSNGFTIGNVSGIGSNTSTFASWTFREAPKFFDVVTYTGNGSSLTLAHTLGVTPGCIIVKRIDTTSDWSVYHRSLSDPNTFNLRLNTAISQFNNGANFISGASSTNFTVNNFAAINASGGTYVAYLFAHDPTADGIIQCGSYTGNGSATGPVVNLGWEPQWLLIKRATASNDFGWVLFDNMRGMPVGGADAFLSPNFSEPEYSAQLVDPSATGFSPNTTAGDVNANGSTYVYMAIRRGPMRTPTLGTSVFAPVTYTGNGSTSRNITAGFPVDFFINANPTRAWNSNNYALSRLTNTSLKTDTTAAEAAIGSDVSFTTSNANTGVFLGSASYNGNTYPFVDYFFRRAPGFMDVVCYTGTNSGTVTFEHNLGVVPELIITKSRTSANDWWTTFNMTASNFQLTALNYGSTPDTYSYPGPGLASRPTASSVEIRSFMNPAGSNVAYLFASAPGVSKVGSYTGNGSSQTINCAFTTGARFVMIKRTNANGDWYVWDSARGIVAGNDPYLALNSTAAEVTTNDSVDTDSSGFVVNQVAATNVNVNAATYIYLAIA